MTLTTELYEELRRSILRGELQPGSRLPSTRALAEERGVSRNTVLNAFEQLLSEGYVEARVGSGTCVARALPEELLTVRAPQTKGPRKACLSMWCSSSAGVSTSDSSM
jgi:GntR family transcriptional regulator/MocR family aminotransferase